jgi:O-antigen/teichoic acid export membrane protein
VTVTSRPTRLVLTTGDQVVSSSSNFLVGVLVGRYAGPGPYGAYILAFTMWLLVVGIHRALVTEPVVIDGGLHDDRAATLRRGLIADLRLAVVLALLLVPAGVLATVARDDSAGPSLLVLAVLLPALITQDYWRSMAFALGRPGMALLNDAAFVAVQVAALAVVIAAGGRTAPWFLLAWGAGAVTGAMAGFVQFRVNPFGRRRGPLFAYTWPFSRWLLADFLTIFAVDQTYVLLVALLLGPEEFGGLRAALSLMGPTAVILLTGGNLGLPMMAEANAGSGVDGLVRVATKLTRVVGAAVLGYCVIVFAVGPTLLTWIYGPEFSSAGNLTRVAAVTYAVAVASFGAGIAIRVARHARAMWMARLSVACLSGVSTVLLASALGVTGAAWAGVITAAAGAAATLAVFRSYVTTARRRAGMAPKTHARSPRVGAAPQEPPTMPPGPGMGVILGLSATEGHDAAVERD